MKLGSKHRFRFLHKKQKLVRNRHQVCDSSSIDFPYCPFSVCINHPTFKRDALNSAPSAFSEILCEKRRYEKTSLSFDWCSFPSNEWITSCKKAVNLNCSSVTTYDLTKKTMILIAAFWTLCTIRWKSSEIGRELAPILRDMACEEESFRPLPA